MKTLAELLVLIAKETELNQKYHVKFYFDVNTQHNWVTMHTGAEIDGSTEIINTVCSNVSIETIEGVQQAYWTIYNNGRTKNENQ